MVHEGPGLCQPDGVVPGVNHLFAPSEPEMYGFSVMPGEKRLLLCELEPVMLSVMSEIRVIQGVEQGTLGFQEPALSTGKAATVDWGRAMRMLSTIAVIQRASDQRTDLTVEGVEFACFVKVFS